MDVYTLNNHKECYFQRKFFFFAENKPNRNYIKEL